jgi:hypothetical protein
MMKLTHRRGGRCHRTLQRLQQGPATIGTLKRAVGVNGAAAKKYWRLLATLCLEGLISRNLYGRYQITGDGEAALAMLEADTKPTVRIFQPEACA